MEMKLDRKQIRAIFLFEFKNGLYSGKTSCNISHASSPGTANEHTVQRCTVREVLHELRALKLSSTVAAHKKLHWQLRAIIEPNPLTATWEVGKELNINHSTVVWHLKQTAKVKKLSKQVPHELSGNFFKSSFWSALFSYSMRQQQTISQMDCGMWWKVDCIW